MAKPSDGVEWGTGNHQGSRRMFLKYSLLHARSRKIANRLYTRHRQQGRGAKWPNFLEDILRFQLQDASSREKRAQRMTVPKQQLQLCLQFRNGPRL